MNRRRGLEHVGSAIADKGEVSRIRSWRERKALTRVVLRRAWDGWKTAAHSRSTQERRRLASCWVSAVLEMALPSPVDGRSKAGRPRDSGPDLSDGCRESDVGSTPHSRRVAYAGLRGIGGNGFRLDATSAEATTARAALADPPLTFLCNHREAIAAMDFFTVPTLTFGVLCCHPRAYGPRNHMKTLSCQVS